MAQSLIDAANRGNATAARAVLERTTFGIAKERAVWMDALSQIDHEIIAAVSDPRPRAIPQIDQRNPEAAAAFALSHPVDISALASRTSARVTTKEAKGGTKAEGRQAVGERAAGRPSRTSRQGRRQARQEEPEPEDRAEAYEGRKRTAYERRTGEAWATRYDPDNVRWRVPASDSRYDEWPARRRRRSRARQRYERAVESGVVSTVRQTPALLGVAAAGAIAYYVTSRILEENAEGVTAQNMYGNAVALAHSEARRRLGREVTREEHAQLRRAIAKSINDEIAAGTAPPPLGALRRVISLLRG